MPASLGLTLPLEIFHTILTAHRHEVVFSDDPGRYLCNQLFFIALDFLRHQGIPCPARFIHLPLGGDYPTARATYTLGHLVQEISYLWIPK